jgi:hypothetical protein
MSTASTAILVAIVSLVSTIVGASIGALTNYILAVRREKADSEKENRAHAIEVKRAARLIDMELAKAQALADIALRKRYWVTEFDAGLSIESWQKYGGTIAPDLSDSAWLALTVAIQALEHIKGSRDLYLSGVLRDLPISDKCVDGIDKMLRDVLLGRDALTLLARPNT